jgi:hypothetical protein
MPQLLDQFSKNLRLKLTNVECGLDGVKRKIDGKIDHAEQHVRKHLDSLRRRTEQNHSRVTAAEAQIKTWLDERKSIASRTISDWQAHQETAKLQNRADRVEQYAGAALDVAMAAVDNAEQAALEAWLARQDAKIV